MSATAPVQLPDTELLKRQGLAVIEVAKSIKIGSDPEYQTACAELVRVVNVRNGIKAAFAEPKRLADQAHKAITKLENELLRYPGQAEQLIKGAISTYQLEEARKRREEEARLEAELRRKAEDERLQEAEQLSDAGQKEAAELLISQPILAPVVEIAKPTAPGVTTRRKWGFRIVDASAIHRDFLVPNETKIRQTVTALGPDAAKLIGGIEIVEESVVAVRTNA